MGKHKTKNNMETFSGCCGQRLESWLAIFLFAGSVLVGNIMNEKTNELIFVKFSRNVKDDARNNSAYLYCFPVSHLGTAAGLLA